MLIRPSFALAAALVAACSAGAAPIARDPSSPSLRSGAVAPTPVAAQGLPPPAEPSVVRAFTSAVQYLPTPPTVNAVDLVDDDVGWIGGPAAIFATTDGGGTWVRQYEGPIDVRVLDFVDRRNGFALGAEGLLATTDGGARWEQRSVPSIGIRSVDFATATVGWGIAGGEGSGAVGDMPYLGGRLAATADGGRTWGVRDAPASAQSVCFLDAQRGWVGDANRVWSSGDGGSAWRVALSAFLVAPDRIGWRAQVRCAGEAVWVQFAAGGAGGTGYQVIYRSADAGRTWLLVTARGPTSPFQRRAPRRVPRGLGTDADPRTRSPASDGPVRRGSCAASELRRAKRPSSGSSGISPELHPRPDHVRRRRDVDRRPHRGHRWRRRPSVPRSRSRLAADGRAPLPHERRRPRLEAGELNAIAVRCERGRRSRRPVALGPRRPRQRRPSRPPRVGRLSPRHLPSQPRSPTWWWPGSTRFPRIRMSRS